MTLSNIGRILLALVATAALGLGMTACGGGTVGYLWVLGTQYNQISAFKIDDYTGNLTVTPHSPFSSGGVDPVSIVVKTGGRFVYVINQGAAASGSTAAVGGAIAEFSVGGDGTLVYQQTFFSQGTSPLWAVTDSTGNYLYVLDKFSPKYGTVTNGVTDLNGDITVFSIDGNTGRLTLIPNIQSATGTGQTQLTYFEVNPCPAVNGVTPPGCVQSAPKMIKISSGCIYTLFGNSIYPFSVNSSNGQLTTTTTGSQTFQAPSASTTFPNPATPVLSSINFGGSYVYLTDTANNAIYPLTGGSTACTLNTVSPGIVANLPLTANPVNAIASNNGKYLYVVNQSSTTNPLTPANSTISAFTIDTNGALAPLSDSSNPYPIGSGPVCIGQDPSSQYLFTSNNTDSTVTGKVINQNTGVLSQLSRGSSFPTSGKPTCLAISGNI